MITIKKQHLLNLNLTFLQTDMHEGKTTKSWVNIASPQVAEIYLCCGPPLAQERESAFCHSCCVPVIPECSGPLAEYWDLQAVSVWIFCFWNLNHCCQTVQWVDRDIVFHCTGNKQKAFICLRPCCTCWPICDNTITFKLGLNISAGPDNLL